MTSLFKNSKKALSFVLAFAIFAMSLFTNVGFAVYADSGTLSNCATRSTIYWDGDVAEGIATGIGTKADPYIIKTADELAWLVKNGKADNTAGKYYKIDDSIGTIILQPQTKAQAIMRQTNATSVKAYFEANVTSVKAWPNMGWEQTCFAGDFDGNGVTIYGLYQASDNNAGLFSTVDAGAAFHNIALKNSYITSTATDYQVGGIAAVSSGEDYGVKANGAIWFDSCVVANNYIHNASNSHDSTGVVIGASSDIVYMDNCLVYGNNATYAANYASTYTATEQDPEWKSHPEDYKLLAFTFDDGPSANMSRYTELFSLYEGTGTFFVRGISITGDSSYQTMQSAINAGWDIGNHGDKHLVATIGGANGGEATYDEIKADIDNLTNKLQSNLKNIDGTPYKVRFYRPPNIKPTDNTFKICDEENLGVIWLKYDALDWDSSKTYNDRYNVFKNGIGNWQDGDVILCHEVGVVGAEDTYKILEELLPGFYEAGYRFCSISELMQMRGITQSQISGKLENTSNNKGMVTNIIDVARDKTAPVWSCANNSVIVSDSLVKPEGLEMTDDGAETPRYYNMIRNSIILDTPAFDCAQIRDSRFNDPKCYENVFTNVDFENYLLVDGKIFAATEEQIKVVSELDDEELPSAFIKTDSMPELRSFHDDAIANGADGHSVSCSCGLVDSSITPHSFANDCQLGCLFCGWTPNGHSYDSACDSDCNTCGAMRTPSAHKYDNNCDTSCNVCGDTRTVPDHIYDDKYDVDCNECGAVREVPPRDWSLSVNATGVYNITPGKTLSGFNKDSITVLDKNGKAVKYNDAKEGWPLVAGQSYTVKLNSDFDNINNLTWNLTKRADTIFTDTASSEKGGWYNDAVTYAVGAGLINGYGGTTKFGTADNIQRQDFVVILARLAGVDLDNYVSSGNYSFADVPSGAYYEKAIMWAADVGITTGYAGGTVFGVGDKITREQLVTFLYRYAKYTNGGVAPTVSENAVDNAAAYADFAAVTDYAREAVIWALENGVIKGQGGTHIAPGGNALRCEVAQIIYNIFLNDTL